MNTALADAPADDTVFYVALRSGTRTALLAGPFTDRSDADAAVPAAITKAATLDPWVWGYDRGVVSGTPKPGRPAPKVRFTPADLQAG